MPEALSTDPSSCPARTSAECGKALLASDSVARAGGVDCSAVGPLRPLPTPCRARSPVLPGEAAPLISFETLQRCTALETGDVVFDEVCEAALRVLQPRDFGGAALPSSASTPFLDSPPVQISLADHVGPLTFDLTSQQLPLGRDIGAAFSFLEPWPHELEYSLPGDLPLHPATRSLLTELLPTLDLQTHVMLDELKIFTDGSFDGHTSGWSVVVVGLRADAVRWLRWFTGRVCVDRQHTLWLGAARHGAQEAELTAVCFALMWVLSMCRLDQLGLLSDSLVSLQRACGHWQFQPDHVLAQSCRNFSQAVEALHIQPWRAFHHVRAHCGQQWNEFADVLAKSAVAKDPGFSFHLDLGAWVRDKALDSLWLLLAAWQEPAIWPRLQGTVLVADGEVEYGEHSAASFFGLDGEPSAEPSPGPWRCVRFATANVQSLEDSTARDGLHCYEGRVGLIRAQMAHRAIHVVAIQEARTERAQTLLSTQYLRFCSGRTASGQLGVEIWLLRTAQADGISFVAEDVVVTHFDPRLLCVRVTSPFMRAVIAAIHAPVATDVARDAWWLSLLATLKRVASDLPLVLIGDWNSRFGAPVCSRVGDLVFPSRFPVSPHTWEILARFDVWLPSTFASCHTGPSDTCSSASARLDYVGIPAQWKVGPAGSRVLFDVDLGQRSLDHMPVLVEVWLSQSGGTRVRKGVPLFDRAAMTPAEGQSRIRAICQGAPSLPWALDASSHFAELEAYFVHELKLAFPPRRKCRRDSFLTDATWTLRDHRLWLRRSACLYRAQCRQPDVCAAVRAWRKGCGLASARLFVTASLCAGAEPAICLVRRLRETRLELRRCLRADKRAWVAELARQAAASPVRDVVAKLRPLIQPKRHAQLAERPACGEVGKWRFGLQRSRSP